MSIHIHSKIAHEAVKPSLENIRKAIRFVLFSQNEALTAEEILEQVKAYMLDESITINSIAPRITEMLDESNVNNPPKLKVVGFKEYAGHGGRKVRRRTLRPMTESEMYHWQQKQVKIEKEERQDQLQLFSLIS